MDDDKLISKSRGKLATVILYKEAKMFRFPT